MHKNAYSLPNANLDHCAISCALPDETSMLTEEDIKLQRHKHTHTCHKKKSFRRCKFGIPYPPMVSTKIIEPLELDASSATKEEIAANAALKNTAKKYML